MKVVILQNLEHSALTLVIFNYVLVHMDGQHDLGEVGLEHVELYLIVGQLLVKTLVEILN